MSTVDLNNLTDVTKKGRGGWAITPEMYESILKYVQPGETILELGSGTGTIELLKTYKMISVEHDGKWVGTAEGTKYIHAEIKPLGAATLAQKGQTKWYDPQAIRKGLEGETWSALLVDGPPGTIGRSGMLDFLELFDLKGKVIFMDDTHRADEQWLTKELASYLPFHWLEVCQHGHSQFVVFVPIPIIEQPLATFPAPAANGVVVPGFIPKGNDVRSEVCTVAEAAKYCQQNPLVRGFCFESADPQPSGVVKVWYKGSNTVQAVEGWSSFVQYGERLEPRATKNLVFTSAGERSSLLQWVNGPRNFDLWVVYYKDHPGKACKWQQAADIFMQHKGGKFENMKWVYDNFGDRLAQYDAVLVMDDDVLIDASAINTLFDIRDKFDLSICQAGFDPKKGKISWDITKCQFKPQLRYVSFLEMTCPMFKRTELDKFMAVFDPELKGWGADWWFLNVCGGPTGDLDGKCAIVDAVPCINPYDRDKEGGFREIEKLQGTNARKESWAKMKAKHKLQEWPKKEYRTVPI